MCKKTIFKIFLFILYYILTLPPQSTHWLKHVILSHLPDGSVTEENQAGNLPATGWEKRISRCTESFTFGDQLLSNL